MSVETMLLRGRAAAEALMLDECTIGRPTGRVTDADGNVTTTYRQLYAGACKVQTQVLVPESPDVGGRAATLSRLRIDVPVDDTVGVTVDDVVTIVAAEFDEDLEGKAFRVVAPFHASQKTARRLAVEEVVG